MAVNYNVQANLININNDLPQTEDVFLVDTNVWLWVTYSRASQSGTGNIPESSEIYTNYIDKILEVGAKIYCSNISLIELTHLIERIECDIFNTDQRLTLTSKEFRHSRNPVVEKCKKEISTVWAQVQSISDLLPLNLNSEFSLQYIEHAKEILLDGYDIPLLMHINSEKNLRILTDDGDFSCVGDITVHTANKRVLSAGRRNAKILPARN